MRNLILRLPFLCMPAFSFVALTLATQASAAEYHVSPEGNDRHPGTMQMPFRTIGAAARVAQPGDTITVAGGTYRERVNPPRGGDSESRRITYRAASGTQPVIKGSEVVSGWEKVEGGIWKVTLPSSFFGEYNPYRDVITGDWFDAKGLRHHTGEVYLDEAALAEAATLDELSTSSQRGTRKWYAEADETSTTIWAGFGESNPNKSTAEINVRRYCFYPDEPGRNYITVRGFRMAHAATQWAAPTAEQPGLIGTHWSKGWIVEDNVISDSKCVGLTLGKDRASGHNAAESAEGYTAVVRRALANGWTKEKIGSHVVRNNTIYNCGAAGICGSMGAAFSEVSENRIYGIHRNQRFGGAEQAAIKFHAAIDTVIRGNHISDSCLGLWLDWMSQGTRVTGNLFHDNSLDIFLEVNHGPFVVDNNLFLSGTNMHECSQGGAFAHNLFLGTISRWPDGRSTPYHKPHSTEIAGLSSISGGDHRFYNNIFAGGSGLAIYTDCSQPIRAGGNVYLNNAIPHRDEQTSLVLSGEQEKISIQRDGDAIVLDVSLGDTIQRIKRELVTTSLLGEACIPKLPFVCPDDTPLVLHADYFGKERDKESPAPGPFELPAGTTRALKVSPAPKRGQSKSTAVAPAQ